MSDRNIPSNERSLWDALLDAREYINSAYTLGSYAREIRRTALLKRIDALTDGTPPAVETSLARLTNEQCQEVISFLEDFEWTGLSLDNVRTWDQAIQDARAAPKTTPDTRGPEHG